MLKKISSLLLVITFLLSCSNTEVDGIKLMDLDSQESGVKEIDISHLDPYSNITKIITLADREEIEEFSKDMDYTYLVKPGDKLRVKNFEISGSEEEGEILIVRPDGKINIKTVGLINVINRTAEDIEKLVNDEVKKYLKNTIYMIDIVEYNNSKIYVWGDIKISGVLNYKGRIDLLEAVSMAGGVKFNEKEPIQNTNQFQNKPKAVYCGIVRKLKTPVWIKLNSIILEGKLEYNIELLSEDIIYIYSK